MIRKDLERDAAFAWDVLDRAPYAVLALADEHGAPYCIPVSPAREGSTVYIHCAGIGQKLDCLRANPHVAMTAVCACCPVSAEYTMSYASMALQGKAVLVEKEEEKTLALRRISEKYAAADLDKFETVMEHYAGAARVIRIDVERITGKEACND